jgi:(p)ppGpp synthase/HD superfamily hydrolase
MSLILRAAKFAAIKHAGQFRKFGHSDEPYIVHPSRVAGRVAVMPYSTEEMVAAAWLHDVMEDTDCTVAMLSFKFGTEVSELVQQLTNTSKQVAGLNRAERKQLDRKRLSGVSSSAKIIKLLDRIDNLEDLLNDNLAPVSFVNTYKAESKLLLGVLCGADPEMEAELGALL